MKRPARPKKPASQPFNEAQKVFGANLRIARERAGMSQQQLAEAYGTTRSHVSAIEDGSQNLTFQTAEGMARAMGYTVQQLLSTTTDMADTWPVPTSGEYKIRPNTLAIELPPNQAFEIAVSAAKTLDRAIPLVNPETRMISAVVPRPSGKTDD